MADIPAIVKHMTLAIFKRPGLAAPTKTRFQQAYNIAVAQCQKNGYVVNTSTGMKPTSKALKHEAEGGRNDARGRIFDNMYAWVMNGGKAAEKKAAMAAGNTKLPGIPIHMPGDLPGPSTDYNEAHHLGRNKKK